MLPAFGGAGSSLLTLIMLEADAVVIEVVIVEFFFIVNDLLKIIITARTKIV